MRIIAGKYRSRVLVGFDSEGLRPTSDRVKESLFGILSPRIYGSRVLDLFCGSGNLGIEALSRGAKEVVFNDSAKASVEILKRNLRALKIEGQEILNYDYMSALDRVSGTFDIIFLDPPYKEALEASALEKIARRGLLSDGGVAVCEKDRLIEERIEGLERFDARGYGKTYLSFFRKIKHI